MVSTYNVILDFARKMEDEFDAAESEKFVNSFSENGDVNIATNFKVGVSSHVVLMNFNHFSLRNTYTGKIKFM